MTNSTNLNTRKDDHEVSALEFRRQLALRTNHGTGTASEASMHLGSLFGKDTPKDHFTATSASPKALSVTDTHSLKQETNSTIQSSLDPMCLARERTDSEKAVKGSDDESPIGGRVGFQEDMVIEVADHIPNDSSDELNRRGAEAEAIINGTDRAFNSNFGSHFDEEVTEDSGLWPLAASNREEAEAMVEGLERAYGN